MTEETVDDFAAKLPAGQAAILAALRKLIKAAVPKAEEAVKWAQPVYSSDGPMLFIRAAKAHVTFGFWRGAQLNDPKGLLEGDGDRMRHIKLRNVKEIDSRQITAWIKQAAKLNKELGNPTLKRKA